MRLLLASLFTAGVTPHAAPVVGWRIVPASPTVSSASSISSASASSASTSTSTAAASAASAASNGAAVASTASAAASSTVAMGAWAGGTRFALLSEQGETLHTFLSRSTPPDVTDIYPAEVRSLESNRKPAIHNIAGIEQAGRISCQHHLQTSLMA